MLLDNGRLGQQIKKLILTSIFKNLNKINTATTQTKLIGKIRTPIVTNHRGHTPAVNY